MKVLFNSGATGIVLVALGLACILLADGALLHWSPVAIVLAVGLIGVLP